MKCNTCIHEWYYSGDWTSPYGEYACMKTQNDLYRVESKDIEDCEHYEYKNNSYANDTIKDIKMHNLTR